jgi:hypothetical protein
VRVGRDPQVSPGDLVPLAFDPVDLHLFDPETGQAVAPQICSTLRSFHG